MTLSTASFFAADQSAGAFGDPTRETLLSAVPALYLAAAFLQHVRHFAGAYRSTAFLVRAYIAGASGRHVANNLRLLKCSRPHAFMRACMHACMASLIRIAGVDCYAAALPLLAGVLLLVSTNYHRTLCRVGPKAVLQHEDAEAAAAVAASQGGGAGAAPREAPWDLAWANFARARRHLRRIAELEAAAEAGLNPMHVVQREETIASIASVRRL